MNICIVPIKRLSSECLVPTENVHSWKGKNTVRCSRSDVSS